MEGETPYFIMCKIYVGEQRRWALLTSFLKGSIKAMMEGYLLIRSTYRSTISAVFLYVPTITSYLPLL